MGRHEERVSRLTRLIQELVDIGSLGEHIECGVEGKDQEQRVYVTLASDALEQRHERKIIGVLLDFPFLSEEEPFKVLKERRMSLPTSVGLWGWRPNQFATLHVGLRHAEREIAEWVDQLLMRVLGADENYELETHCSWRSS
jgi:hypothetical protein